MKIKEKIYFLKNCKLILYDEKTNIIVIEYYYNRNGKNYNLLIIGDLIEVTDKKIIIDIEISKELYQKYENMVK